MVKVISGPLDWSAPYHSTPKERWQEIFRDQVLFVDSELTNDCRWLKRFVDEILENRVWEHVGFESFSDLIKNGFHLDNDSVDAVYLWLKKAEPEKAVSWKRAVDIAMAKENPIAKNGNLGNGVDSSNYIRPTQHGTGTEYTLRRLAADEQFSLLDQIEAGKLSVNQAAIEAGYRHKMASIVADDAAKAATGILRHYEAKEIIQAIQEAAEAE